MLTTWLTVIEVIYVLALSIWLILQKRSPLATLAWIFSLAALPIVGFVVYWFLGPRHIRRKRSRYSTVFRRLKASLPDLSVLGNAEMGIAEIEPQKRQMMALALNGAAAPLTEGNSVRLLRNGAEKFPAIEAAIRAAKHHIHLEYYIFEDDQTGQRLRDLLVEKAREGVKVRVLLDALGSHDLRRRFTKPLFDAGAEIGWFNVVLFPRVRPAWNYRNHRKIVVCDAKVGFLGGLNVGDEYAGVGPSFGQWRDTHLQVEGPAVSALQLMFLEDWNFATKKSVTERAYFTQTTPTGDELVQIVGSGPDRLWPSMQLVLFTLITSAQDRVSITTAYFVPDDAILTALTSAALRGVDVKLLVPKRSDSLVVTAAGRSYYDELLRSGVRIYEYVGGILHAKSMTIDGNVGFVGSANLDQRSMRLNFEVGAVLYDEAITRELDVMFEQDLTMAREITAADRSDLPFVQQLGEASARLLSPLL